MYQKLHMSLILQVPVTVSAFSDFSRHG